MEHSDTNLLLDLKKKYWSIHRLSKTLLVRERSSIRHLCQLSWEQRWTLKDKNTVKTRDSNFQHVSSYQPYLQWKMERKRKQVFTNRIQQFCFQSQGKNKEEGEREHEVVEGDEEEKEEQGEGEEEEEEGKEMAKQSFLED